MLDRNHYWIRIFFDLENNYYLQGISKFLPLPSLARRRGGGVGLVIFFQNQNINFTGMGEGALAQKERGFLRWGLVFFMNFPITFSKKTISHLVFVNSD